MLAGDLPFISRDTNWNVSESGDWTSDFNQGAIYADLALESALKEDRLYLISFIIKDMGHFGAVELGFLNRLTEHAITSPSIA